MKCFEKTCGNFWVLEPDEIIFDGMETEDIDTAVPDCTLVNDGSVQGKAVDGDNTNALMLQAEGVIILIPSVKHYLYTICRHINKPFCYLRLSANPDFRT